MPEQYSTTMSSNSKMPLLNKEPDPSDSTVNASTREHLDANLSLAKKRSWFGSLRDILQRGARTLIGTPKAADEVAESPEKGEEADFREIRESSESIASRVTDRPKYERGHTLPGRAAVSTIRRHVAKKRDSVQSIFMEAKKEESLGENDDLSSAGFHTPGHRRHTSLVSSIKGSIRGLGRNTPSMSFGGSPVKAAMVPLPSSPIDIPSAPPALTLNFGASGLTPLTIEPVQSVDTLPQGDVALTGRPHEFGTYMPVIDTAEPGSLSPFLEPPSTLTREPGTPMPGTTLTLECESPRQQETVFERGVETPPGGKYLGRLRPMRSLDAMAKACAAPGGGLGMLNDKSSAGTGSPSTKATMNEKVPPASRNHRVTSASTSKSILSDMPPLARQSQVPKQEEVPETPEEVVNPFEGIANSGVPLPERQVRLPLRPLFAEEKHETAGGGSDATKPPKGNAVLPKEAAVMACPLESGTAVEAYDEFKTQHLFGENIESHDDAEYYDNDSAESTSSASRRATKSSSAEQSVTGEQREAAGTDVGEAFWKFHISSWSQPKDSGAAEGEVVFEDSSDDSRTSIIMDLEMAASIPEVGQLPSMGSRLEFDLKRSARNMRYNALRDPGQSRGEAQRRNRFEEGSILGEDPGVEEGSILGEDPRCENAHPGHPIKIPTSPSSARKHREGRSSGDSMAVALEDATVLDIDKLQEHLDELLGGVDEERQLVLSAGDTSTPSIVLSRGETEELGASSAGGGQSRRSLSSPLMFSVKAVKTPEDKENEWREEEIDGSMTWKIGRSVSASHFQRRSLGKKAPTKGL